MSLGRRVRFLYALLVLFLGAFLFATVVGWSLVTYYLMTYLATLALVELLVAPVWRVRWNRRTYHVLFAGLIIFLGLVGVQL